MPDEQQAIADPTTLDLSAVENPRQRAFLAAFCESGSVTRAARAAGIARSNHGAWMDDPAYRKLFEAAKEVALENLEDEARQRAMIGLVRKKFYKGEPVIDPVTGEQYVEFEKSDYLMGVLLKANAPDKYRERVEQTSTATVRHENNAPAPDWFKSGPVDPLAVAPPAAPPPAEPAAAPEPGDEVTGEDPQAQ